MPKHIRVAILDDHQGIIDGYLYRLSGVPDIHVVAILTYGEQLEDSLLKYPVDVLLLDMQVPTSPTNSNPYPILNIIPRLQQRYPELAILVISMYAQRTLIRNVMQAGASGYILKDDRESILNLASLVQIVANGGICFSRQAQRLLEKYKTGQLSPGLTARQLEALSICAAYPDASTGELALTMGVAHSTLRNLLSGVYLKLGVHSRAAAVLKARRLKLLTSELPSINLDDLNE